MWNETEDYAAYEPHWRAALQRTIGRHKLECRFPRPATVEEIETCERALGHPLPTDYRQFLQKSNGLFASLEYRIGSTLDARQLNILGTDLLEHYNREVLREKMGASILFANLTDSDCCGIVYEKGDASLYTVRFYDHDGWNQWPEAAPIIAATFTEYLQRCFAAAAFSEDFAYWEPESYDFRD